MSHLRLKMFHTLPAEVWMRAQALWSQAHAGTYSAALAHAPSCWPGLVRSAVECGVRRTSGQCFSVSGVLFVVSEQYDWHDNCRRLLALRPEVLCSLLSVLCVPIKISTFPEASFFFPSYISLGLVLNLCPLDGSLTLRFTICQVGEGFD